MDWIRNPISGIATAVTISGMYVGSLYLWNFLLGRRDRSRDDPVVICQRIVSVTVSTYLSVMIHNQYVGNYWAPPPFSLVSLGRTVCLLSVLMAGPIYAYEGRFPPLADSSLVNLRNLVVAPITEEIVFRDIILRVLTYSGVPRSVVVGLVGPMLFSSTHLHHYLGKNAAASDIVPHVIMTAFFSWIASYFLLTGSVWDAIVVHSMCNYIGNPSCGNLRVHVMGVVGFLTVIYLEHQSVASI